MHYYEMFFLDDFWGGLDKVDAMDKMDWVTSGAGELRAALHEICFGLPTCRAVPFKSSKPANWQDRLLKQKNESPKFRNNPR